MKFPDELFEAPPKFADSVEPTLADFKTGTVAWLIQRVMEDIAGQTEAKQLGYSHFCGLRAMQRMPFGQKIAANLKRSDFIDFMKWRREQIVPHTTRKVGAATAKQTLTYLSSAMKHACSTWDDCESLVQVLVHLDAAKKFLVKRGVVGKAASRTRRVKDEEVVMLLDYYRRHPGRILRMQEVIAFCLASGRRRGEVCRITWGDIDFEDQLYWVRDLKHPTKKKGNDKQFVLFPVIADVIRRQIRLRPDDPTERVFPFIKESITQSFICAKKAIAKETGDDTILTLRLHDHRAEAISKWLLVLDSEEDVARCVSGHDGTKMIKAHYDRRSTQEVMKHKYQHLMKQPALESPASSS